MTGSEERMVAEYRNIEHDRAMRELNQEQQWEQFEWLLSRMASRK